MQSYTEIPSSQSLQSSLALLLGNDKTALSCSSGSVFPTSNLHVGMLCFRTDLLKLYILKDATPTWSLIWDFATGSSAINSLTWGTSKSIASTDLDALLTSGFYDGDSLTNAPAAGFWHIFVQAFSGGSGYVLQKATSLTANGSTYMRRRLAGTWGSWIKVWTEENDGSGSGLDADTVDGKNVSNASGDIPVSNGAVNANLNADMLDGYNASSFVRTINSSGPDGSGNINLDLSSRLAKSGDTMTGVLTGAAINSTTAVGSDTSSLQVRNVSGDGDGAVAAMSFHCQGAYAIKLHLRPDGFFGFGGWSRSAWSWYSDGSGNMTAAGNVTAYSDPRLKENFERVSSPFDILNKLDGGTFIWKHGYTHTECKAGKRDYGILADQVMSVMPEIVTDSIEIDGESYKTVAYEKLVPVLIEAVKELRAELDALKAGA